MIVLLFLFTKYELRLIFEQIDKSGCKKGKGSRELPVYPRDFYLVGRIDIGEKNLIVFTRGSGRGVKVTISQSFFIQLHKVEKLNNFTNVPSLLKLGG